MIGGGVLTRATGDSFGASGRGVDEVFDGMVFPVRLEYFGSREQARMKS